MDDLDYSNTGSHGRRSAPSRYTYTASSRRSPSAWLSTRSRNVSQYAYKVDYNHPKYAYILMHDKIGWQSLNLRGAGMNSKLLESSTNCLKVDVHKGTLVEIDPSSSSFNPQLDASVVVISLDRPEVKISLLMKEMLPIEEEIYFRLLPLKPYQRYDIMIDEKRIKVLNLNVGDTVWYMTNRRDSEVALIQYIGPVKGLKFGHMYGIELMNSVEGNSDGSYGGHRYFDANPNSGVFTSAASLFPYNEKPCEYRDSQEFREYTAKSQSIPKSQSLDLQSVSSKKYDPRIYSSDKKGIISSVPTTPSSISNNQGGLQVSEGDRIVWITDQGPEFGYVRWIGHIVDMKGLLAGVEFDNPIGSGNGFYNKQRLFSTKYKHASLVPLEGLLKAEDFIDETSTNKRSPNKKRNYKSSHQRVPTPVNYGDSQENYDSENNVRESSSSLSSYHNPRKHSLTPTEENYFNEIEEDLNNENPPSRRSGSSQSKRIVSASPKLLSKLTSKKEKVTSKSLNFDKIEGENLSNHGKDICVGTLVELSYDKMPIYGIVKWMGWLHDQDKTCLGIELEEEMLDATNGWYKGSQLFACPDKKAVFVPLTHAKLDSRFQSCRNSVSEFASYQEFGNIECPVVPGFYPPIQESDVECLFGRNKGIQGHQNSCYLDATLFAMFSFTSVFDSLLYRPQNSKDIPQYNDVQKVLREEIVNSLRKNNFVRADRVMRLRQFLDNLTSVTGLMSEEKDPEEFLNSLLTQALKAEPFLELSSGQTSHLYQLFVERDEALSLPSLQQLLEQSFITSNVKLAKIPSILILQMPRFGNQFKVYDRILPSQYLDVTNIIDESPRQCNICGKVALYECMECYNYNKTGLELDTVVFCESCLKQSHSHQKRRNHQPKALKLPKDFVITNETVPRVFMELFAVVCIETSHYVTFVKCGSGPDASWCFFDSMADRKGESHGYNIPEIRTAPEIPRWFTDEGINFIRSCPDNKNLPTQAKRFICDSYMCFYQSPQVMMYQ